LFLSKLRSELSASFPILTRPLTLFIWFSTSLVAIISGPFGTYAAMDWPVRSVFWVSITTSAVVIGVCVRALTAALVGYRRPIVFDALATVLMTLIFAPLVWGFRIKLGALDGETPVYFPAVALSTFLIAGLVFVTRRHVSDHEPGAYLQTDRKSAASDGEPHPRPRLHRRLSEAATGTILRLSGKGHHVEVVTTEGRETLRLRLTDAILEMEPVEGYCAHRSHWVTRAAITEVEREPPGKIFLVLVNGDRIPVSRKYRCELEAAGIIH
jgi:hypothetical protein